VTPTTDQRPRRFSAAERHEQYLRCAADLVLSDGVSAVTMDAVAAAAGVNKALLYRQFANRGELLLALFDRETRGLDAAVRGAMEGVDGFEAQLRAWVKAWFDYIGTRGVLLGRLMEARTVSDEVAGQHQERTHTIVDVMGAWYEGAFQLPSDVARDAAAMLYAALGGVIERWAASPTSATRQRLEPAYIGTVLGSLRELEATHGTGRRPARQRSR
jgi:AcrR family transcriptional regulator